MSWRGDMLHRPLVPLHQSPTATFNYPSDSSEFIDLERLFAAAQRQVSIVILCALVSLAVGIAYLVAAIPAYSSFAYILIDANQSKIVDEMSAVPSAPKDEAMMLTQVEILRSEKLAGEVVDSLHLAEDPAFMAPSQTFIEPVQSAINAVFGLPSRILRYFVPDTAPPVPPSEDSLRTRAAYRLMGNLDVERVGKSYVLSVSYTSPDPRRATEITQAYADAYLSDQLESKYDATRRATGWLDNRIEDLRQTSIASDMAVQKYRAENNLLAVDGRLVSDQQLSQVSGELIQAQSETAKAKAKYDRIRSIIDRRDTTAVVSDALDSSLINSLRESYLNASRRESQISERYGANHQQAVNLRAEMAEYERQMFDELGRIAESYNNEYQVAKAREDALRSSLSEMSGVNANANETQVHLRELERQAESVRALYQTFLQRRQEALQQESFPITEARIIGPANPTGTPSQPRTLLVVAGFLVFGLAGGAAVGALREFRDRFFRTGDQVRQELELEF